MAVIERKKETTTRIIIHNFNRKSSIHRQRPRVYPTVERLGITEPFHQHLASVITSAQLRLDTIRLVRRHDDLLQFWFVEGAVQAIPIPVDQSIHGRIRTVHVNDRKQFFRPVRHVAFRKVSFRLAYTHTITNSILGRTTPSWPYNRCHTIS